MQKIKNLCGPLAAILLTSGCSSMQTTPSKISRNMDLYLEHSEKFENGVQITKAIMDYEITRRRDNLGPCIPGFPVPTNYINSSDNQTKNQIVEQVMKSQGKLMSGHMVRYGECKTQEDINSTILKGYLSDGLSTFGWLCGSGIICNSGSNGTTSSSSSGLGSGTNNSGVSPIAK